MSPLNPTLLPARTPREASPLGLPTSDTANGSTSRVAAIEIIQKGAIWSAAPCGRGHLVSMSAEGFQVEVPSEGKVSVRSVSPEYAIDAEGPATRSEYAGAPEACLTSKGVPRQSSISCGCPWTCSNTLTGGRLAGHLRQFRMAAAPAICGMIVH